MKMRETTRTIRSLSKRRARFINIGQLYTNKILCFNFGPGKEKHLQRRLKNSRGITKEKWKEVFNFMKNSYEEPTLDEDFIEILNIKN